MVRQRISIEFIIFIFFLLCNLTNTSELGSNSDEACNSVYELIYRWRWSDALDALGDPQCSLNEYDKNFIRGYALLRLGRYEQAESLYALLLGEKYDLSDWVSIFLAQSAYKNGDYDAAFRFAKLAAILPGFTDTIVQIRWRSLRRLKKIEEAIAQLDTLYWMKMLGKWQYKFYTALCLLDSGDEKRSKMIFTEILDSLYMRRSWRWLVRSAANKLAEYDFLNDKQKRLLGLSYYYVKDYKNAIKWLGQYSKIDNSPKLKYYLAVSYAKSYSYKTALSKFSNLLKNNEYQRPTLWWRIGFCHRKLGQYTDAKIALDSALTQCKNCGNKIYIIQERIFLAQDRGELRQFAHNASLMASADAGGNKGAIGTVWALTGYIASGAPDSAVVVARRFYNKFPSKDFRDEIKYWEAQALFSSGDSAKAKSVLFELARANRYNLFVWLAREQLGMFNSLNPDEFLNLCEYNPDTVWQMALDYVAQCKRTGSIDVSLETVLPETPLRLRAERLAKLGMTWLAKPCFKAMEKESIKKKPLKEGEMLALWKYFYSLRLYDMAQKYANTLYTACPDEDGKSAILPLIFMMPFGEEVAERCRIERIDPYFLYAVMFQESRFNPFAVSHANAMGLMQFIQKTGSRVAKWIGIKEFDKDVLFDYKSSISLGARLLSHLLGQRMSPYFALAEYNAGDFRVDLWVKNCPDRENEVLCAELFDSKETRLFTKKILGYYYTYHFLYGGLNYEWR